MVPTLINVLLLVCLLFSIYYFLRKRKKAGITDFKSALTSICFFLIAITNLAASVFDFLGGISWLITISLLLLAAYFMKYLPASAEPDAS